MTQSSFETRLRLLSAEISELRAIEGDRCEIPRPMWSAAVALCKEGRVSVVAAALRLGKSGLYQRMGSATMPPRRTGRSSRPHFVQVTLPMAPPISTRTSDFQIELAHKDGGVMRIKDPQAHGLFLSVLIQSFMAHGSGQIK